ncbi:MAG: GNAT family N-acetyltransferase [Candidatus Marinimicrobia bacterium]|nr:GNAT family N-acetyltransferase [Candidatus Neomarinimicrobiota bacterium]
MKIEVSQNPKPEDLQIVSEGLQSHNTKYVGGIAIEEELKFAVFARDDVGNIIGGIRAVTFWDWVNIEVIWVKDSFRLTGIGKQLLKKAEEYSKRNKLHSVCLETTSFQALEFYKKLGYVVFGELDDFPKGHTMYYMKKVLI